MTAFDDAMQKLAEVIAKKAADDNTPLAEKIDALGKLTPYYALILKKRPHEEDGDETIEGIQETLRRAEEDHAGNGHQREATPTVAGVPARRGRRFAASTN